MDRVRPKKALGQHFLTDMGVAQRIAATLDDYASLPVLEIGPGTGVLTRFLLERHPAGLLTLVEIDSESVVWLRDHLDEPQPRVVEADFLTEDFDALMPGDGQVCVIGNYPYNISSQIFSKSSTIATAWCAAAACSSARWPKGSRRLPAPRPAASSVFFYRHGTALNISSPSRNMSSIRRQRSNPASSVSPATMSPTSASTKNSSAPWLRPHSPAAQDHTQLRPRPPARRSLHGRRRAGCDAPRTTERRAVY